MDKNSVYNQITAALKEYPELPYTFQDVGSAGKLDVIFSLWKDDIGFKEKFFYVYHLIEKIQEAMEVGFVPENAKAWIKNNAPLIAYHTLFNDRLRLMLREGKMDEKALYPIGLELATKGHTGEEVKLGMLILGHFKNDLARRILRTLGLHSEFTLFAIEASKNFKDHNSFVFYLAKNTTGYGKLASIALLEPITEEQRDWMLTEGAINEVARDLSAVICLDKEDMAFYYQDFEVSKTNYGYFSRLLAYGGQKGFIRAFPGSLNIVNGYLNEVMGEINSFIELAAVVMIWINLGSSWEEFNEEYKTHDWTREINNDIKDQCNGILKSAKWDNLILRELENPTESTRLILTVMDRLNFLPWLNKLVPLLDRDLFDLDIMTFTLIEHPRFYAGVILEYLKALLPKEVFSGPMDIKKEEYTSEYKPDIWLVHLLKAMISEGEYLEQFMEADFFEKDFLIKCLKCRFPDVRIEAIKVFRLKRDSWFPHVCPFLEEALEIEPVANIRKRLGRILGKTSGKGSKECRFVEIGDLGIKLSPIDVKLMDSEIAGVFYRDMTVVEGEVEKGDILYLIREPDNQYDEKAVMVTAEDGYLLGYIPREDNPALSAMLDSGERLYALLGSDIVGGRPSISIMLNRPIEEGGNIIPFPGLWQ